MDRAEFWNRIAQARGDGSRTADDVAKALAAQVAELPPAEIAAFQGWLDAYRYAANRRELWAAVSYVSGGCGDDGFDYFRGWLIAQGEQVYLSAVCDPQSLAEHRWPGDDERRYPDLRCEWMLGIGSSAYEAVTGQPLDDDADLPVIEEQSGWPDDRITDYDWTDEDVLRLFPRLATRWPQTR